MNNQFEKTVYYLKDKIISKYSDYNSIYALIIIFFIIKLITVIRLSSGPIIPDEFLYKFNAEVIFNFHKYGDPHYPPLYPIFLSASLFFENWYEAMLGTNVALGSLTILATWFLAQEVGLQRPMVPALLMAILPLHTSYPQYIYSENLLIPIFCLAITLTIRGYRAGTLEGILFGVILAAAQLTKYLALPALPLLYVTWVWSRYTVHPENIPHPGYRPYFVMIMPLIGYAAVFGTWLWYGQSWGFTWTHLMGLDISSAGRWAKGLEHAATKMPKGAGFSSFALWGTAYFSHLVLVWLPFVTIFSAVIGHLPRRFTRISFPRTPQSIFTTLTVILVAGYWLVSTLHSFGAPYNYPSPRRLIGRYAIHLAPLLVVLVSMTLEIMPQVFNPKRLKASITLSFLSILFGILAWFILVFKGIWNFPDWVHKNPINLINFNMIEYIIYFTLCCLCAMSTSSFRFDRNKANLNLLTILLITITFHTVALSIRMEKNETAFHIRQISSYLNSKTETNKYYYANIEKTKLTDDFLKTSINFWNSNANNISTIEKYDDTNDEFSKNVLFITKQQNLNQYEKKYEYNNKTYYIYKLSKNEFDRLNSSKNHN